MKHSTRIAIFILVFILLVAAAGCDFITQNQVAEATPDVIITPEPVPEVIETPVHVEEVQITAPETPNLPTLPPTPTPSPTPVPTPTPEPTPIPFSYYAPTVNMTFEEYIHALFGDGITEDIIREYAKLTTLTNKYYLQVYNGYSYTDEDYEKYFEENKTSYQYADFIQYNFSYASGSETSTDEAAQKAAREKAKAYADNLAQCKTATEFKSYVRDYLTKNPELVTASADHTLTEQELKEAIETEVEKCAYEKYA